MTNPNFRESLSATRTLSGAHMPGERTDEYFPLEENYADQHQLRMRAAILDDDIDVVGNVNPTGSGKTLSWLAPTIRSGESDDGWIVLATYPTRALIEDQLQSIRARFEQYYSAVWPPRCDGHTLREADSGPIIDTGDDRFSLTDQVRSITGEDTVGRLTGTVFMEAFEDARSASRAGIPTVILTTPDMLSVLATDRVKSRDAGQFPGLVDAIVVDEFHLANLRGKRLLPFHLDVYMRLTDQRFLDTLVFLSATPDAQVIEQLENAFTTEIIGPDAASTAEATGAETTREILPETPFHIETRRMFSNGEWLAEKADELLEWHAGDVGQTVAIVDSVREVEVLTDAMQAAAPDDLTVGAVSGWHSDNHQATIDSADIVVGNSALEVGVDFDAIGRLVCTAYDANSAIQRIGRMRARTGIGTQEIAVITSGEAHSELLAHCEQGRLSRDALQTAFRKSISETAAAPYFELLCAAYTRYLWEYADHPLRERVTPQEELYQEIVRDHFTERVARLPDDVVDMDALWDELEETLETYRARYRDGGALGVFKEMHDYRPGSLSALIVDSTDSDQLYKEYQLGYVLRYGTGRFVSDNIGLETVFKDVHRRRPTDDELAHLREIDRRAAGRMVLTGTQSEPRSYTIEAFNQATKWRKRANSESAAGCFPRRLTNGKIGITEGHLEGLDYVDIAGDVLVQYTPVGPYEAKQRYRLGPFGNVLSLTEHDSLALWQDATLVHARLMSDWLIERNGSA